MNKKQLYKEGIKQQKSLGWTLVVFGVIFCLTIILIPFGLPLIFFGINFIVSKEVNAITAEMIRKKIRK